MVYCRLRSCVKPPAPEAWFMQPFGPNLTQRMLNELSPSPTTAIGD
ncbi:lysis system o-spanin lipoprotein Rz1 [Pseudomonas sp. zjy_11]